VTDRNIRYLLDQAFERLRADGYFAEPDWTCCRSCGVYELPPGTEDYVFFNLQDAEHLRERGDVYLNHGGDGEHIVRRLREAGLRVDWDGSDDTAIHVSMPEQTALGGTDIGMEDGKWERAHRLHEHIHNMIAEDDVPLPEVAVVACVLMIGGVLAQRANRSASPADDRLHARPHRRDGGAGEARPRKRSTITKSKPKLKEVHDMGRKRREFEVINDLDDDGEPTINTVSIEQFGGDVPIEDQQEQQADAFDVPALEPALWKLMGDVLRDIESDVVMMRMYGMPYLEIGRQRGLHAAKAERIFRAAVKKLKARAAVLK
jgi:hypothetical protein